MFTGTPGSAGLYGADTMKPVTMGYLFSLATVLLVFTLLAGCVEYPEISGNNSTNNTTLLSNATNTTNATPGHPGVPVTPAQPRTGQTGAPSNTTATVPPRHNTTETGNTSGPSMAVIGTGAAPAAVNTSTAPKATTVIPTPTPPPPTHLNYTNAAYPFSLVYPANWTKEEVAGAKSGILVKFHSPIVTLCNTRKTDCADYVGTLSVSVDPAPKPSNIEEYYNKAIGAVQEKYQITATTKNSVTTLSGMKAYSITYITKDARGNPDKQVLQYYAILYGKGYVITYSAGFYEKRQTMFPQYEEEAESIISTFRVEKPPPIQG